MTGTLRAVLVGCGRISKVWLTAARDLDDLAIVGLVDVREDAAVSRRAEFGLWEATVGTDLPATLATTNPDLVFDCTVPAAHASVRLAALAHGAHVLGEKPLADSMAGARAIVAAARAANRRCAITQNRRYQPRIRQLRALVAGGEIGELTTVDSDHYLGNRFEDFRDEMHHPLLLDMAIHTFDQARVMTGADPVRVYCKEWNPAGSWYREGASAVAIFELTGGIVYTYRGSWCAEGAATSADSVWRLIGQRGSATWDSVGAVYAEAVVAPGGLRTTGRMQSLVQPVTPPSAGNADKVTGHAGILREFIDCVRTGTEPETDCADNIKSLAMVFGAIESAERDQPVAVRW